MYSEERFKCIDLRAIDILPLIRKMPNSEIRKLARALIDLI